MKFLNVMEGETFSVDGSSSDSIAMTQIENALSERLTGINTERVRVHLVNSANLLTNASFEKHTGGNFDFWNEEWADQWVFYSTAASKHGPGSVLIDPDSRLQFPYLTRVYQDCDALPHTDYVFEVWVKTENVAVISYSQVYMVNDDGSGTSVYYPSQTITGTNDWMVLKGQFNTGNYHKIRMYVLQNGEQGRSWFDEARIYPCKDICGYECSNLEKLDNIPEQTLDEYYQTVQGLADWQRKQSYMIYSQKETETGCLDYYILGEDPQGRFYGAQSLKQIIDQTYYNQAEGYYDFPYDFTIVDYPDTDFRGIDQWSTDGNIWRDGNQIKVGISDIVHFFNTNNPPDDLSDQGRQILDYFASLKMNKFVFDCSSWWGVRHNGPHWVFQAYWDWDEQNDEWLDLRDINYWIKFQKFFEYCRERYIEPIPCFWAVKSFYPLEIDRLVGNAVNDIYEYRQSFGEGFFCNRIPFIFGETYAVPDEYAPCLSFQKNSIKNPGFEIVKETSDPDTDYIPQSYVEGQNYFLLKQNKSKSFTFNTGDAHKFRELELNFFAKLPDNSVNVNMSMTGVADYDYIPTPTPTPPASSIIPEWRHYRYAVDVGNSTQHTLTFQSPSNADLKLDHIKYVVTNLLKNGRFEYMDGTNNFSAWNEVANGGTVSTDSYQFLDGAQSVKLTRPQSFGVSSLWQDITSHPDKIHRFTVCTGHNLDSNSTVYCEIYHLVNGQQSGPPIQSNILGKGSILNWYQHSIIFRSNEQGTFRIYLKIEGDHNSYVNFDNANLISEKVSFAYLGAGYGEEVNFENIQLFPKEWTINGNYGDLTMESSAEGNLAFKVITDKGDAPLWILKQTFSWLPYSDYEAGLFYYPNRTSPYLASSIKVGEVGGSTLLNEIPLRTQEAFHVNWQQFQKGFSTTNSSSGEITITNNAYGNSYYDGIYIIRSNQLSNSSFEHFSGNDFVLWNEGGVSLEPEPDSDSFDGNWSVKLYHEGVPGTVHLWQDCTVDTHTDYRFLVWTKTDDIPDYDAYCEASVMNGETVIQTVRSNITPVNTKNGWNQIGNVINSGPYTKIRLKIIEPDSSNQGNSWFDCAKIYPCNYVKHGSFEYAVQNGDDVNADKWGMWDWDSGALYVDTADVPPGGGSQSLHFILTNQPKGSFAGVGGRRFYQDFETKPWQNFQHSVWLKASPDFNGVIVISYASKPLTDPATGLNNIPGENEKSSENWVEYYVNPTPRGQWVKIQTPPNNVGRSTKGIFRIYIRPGWNGEWNGEVWFDNVEVKSAVNKISDKFLETNGILAHVVKDDGTILQDQVDFKLEPYDSDGNSSIDTYRIKKLSGNNISSGDCVYVSWNELPNQADHSPFCPRIKEFMKLVLQGAVDYVGPFNYYHIGIDESFYLNVDSRTLSAGRGKSRILDYYISQHEQIKQEIPELSQARLISWGDHNDRYHGEPYAGVFNNEFVRSIDIIKDRVLLVPWGYTHVTAFFHCLNFQLMARLRNVQWVGGSASSNWANSNSSFEWINANTPVSPQQGVCYTQWSGVIGGTEPQWPTYWQGLPCAAEAGWNIDGYYDWDKDDLLRDELLYDPVTLGQTYGDMGQAH